MNSQSQNSSHTKKLHQRLLADLDSQSAAFVPPPIPEVRAVYEAPNSTIRQWDNPLFMSQSGTWQLTGGLGTGVSTLLMDAVAQRILDGTDPNSILVVAPSADAVRRLRRGIMDRLAHSDYSSAEPMVRSVHSLAFALLRSVSPVPIRLITGAEQDAVIRELLQGAVAGHSRVQWPAEIRDALGLVGFARGLRDFLLRAAERGIRPQQLEDVGQRYDRPLWTAAGEFLSEYEQTMELGANHNLSASELLSNLLAYELPETPWRAIFIDDAQHLDPKAAELLQRLIKHTDFAVVAGHPEQTIFRFRGAKENVMETFSYEHHLRLDTKHRSSSVEAHIAPTAHIHDMFIADIVRRSHLIDGIPWSDIAVIVRDAGGTEAVRRTLLQAGVPVASNASNMVLSEQHIVIALLLALQTQQRELQAHELESLALGAVGGADAVTLRRLLRGLRQVEMRAGTNRRAIVLLSELVHAAEDVTEQPLLSEVLSARELEILGRLHRVIRAAQQPGSVEEVLWNIWDATGLAGHLSAVSLRGGAAGSQADRDLDAVLALFDAAGDWVERRPDATIASFIQHIEEQQLETGVRDRRLSTPQAVNVVTAHSAAGQEWDTVLVVSVQEGSWPSLTETGTIFAQQEFVDLIDADIDPNLIISRTPERLRDEQALFDLAVSRATRRTVITAVLEPDADEVYEPSRFMEPYEPREITAVDMAPTVQESAQESAQPAAGADYVRLLSIPAMIAEFRRAVADEKQPVQHRRQAARQLARLAAVNVPGAHPVTWWGVLPPSTQEPLPVRAISPSKIESALSCPLQAALGHLGERPQAKHHMATGTLAHAFAEAIARGVEPTLAAAAVTEAYSEILQVPQWRRPADMDNWDKLLREIIAWHAQQQSFELLGVEVPVQVEIDGITIRGNIDRLQSDEQGNVHIIDLKTGKTPPTDTHMGEHAQLFAYQVAVSHATVQSSDDATQKIRLRTAAPGETPLTVAQCTLFYPRASTKSKTRVQAHKTPEEQEELIAQLPQILHDLQGPEFEARVHDGCRNCSLHMICPAQDTGKLVQQ